VVLFVSNSDVKLYNAFSHEKFKSLELFVPICEGRKDENLQKIYEIMNFLLQV
jgi:hypothetical protein